MHATPLKRFGTGSDFHPDALVILENLGLAIYVAQLYERDLQLVITGLERLGLLTLPPETTRSRDGIVDSCLGPMLRALSSCITFEADISDLLTKAHYQRNLLVHRFIAENISDILNPAGRVSINEKLHRLFTNISRAHDKVAQIRDIVWAQLGVSREFVDQQIAEWQHTSEPPQDTSSNEPTT